MSCGEYLLFLFWKSRSEKVEDPFVELQSVKEETLGAEAYILQTLFSSVLPAKMNHEITFTMGSRGTLLSEIKSVN